MKIGIDLGTTNSALTFIDPRKGADQDFRTEALKALPSLLARERVNT